MNLKGAPSTKDALIAALRKHFDGKPFCAYEVAQLVREDFGKWAPGALSIAHLMVCNHRTWGIEKVGYRMCNRAYQKERALHWRFR